MRLIDADYLKAIRFHDLPYSQIVPADCDTDEKVYAYKLGWNDAIDAIVESAPAVDAEPVVRCKDCYYCTTDKSFGKEYLYCGAFYERAEGDLIGVSLMVEPNHFCSWGERRKDENE